MVRWRFIQQQLSLAAIVLWLGGFTFYASFVVPAGERVVGGLDQGYVTQQVTDRLNAIGGLMVLGVLVDMVVHRKYFAQGWWWARCFSAAVFMAGLVMVVLWHDRMDALLDLDKFSRPDRKAFAPLHQQYLLAMTFMWLACVFEWCAMLHGHRRYAVHAAAASNEKPAA